MPCVRKKRGKKRKPSLPLMGRGEKGRKKANKRRKGGAAKRKRRGACDVLTREGTEEKRKGRRLPERKERGKIITRTQPRE